MKLNYDFNEVMENMLSRLPKDMDKREGSIIWDALAPCAVEICLLYATLDEYLTESFADTASRPYLIKRAMERGIQAKEASPAILKTVVTPENTPINIGDKFTYKDLFFTVTEKISSGVYKIKSDLPGEIGNIPLGDLFPALYIPGFQKAQIDGIITPGTDEEDTEAFRKRYFENLRSLAFGGNIADYKEKSKSVHGVGYVKILPHWNGGGTVKIIFLDQKSAVPSESLIKKVKDCFDPDEFTGEGQGLAPIGHIVTVVGAKDIPINISAKFTLERNLDFASVEPFIESAISDYLENLRKKWEDSQNLIVRISALEYAILSCKGIVDIQNTKINGKNSNLILEFDQVPVKGEIINAGS